MIELANILTIGDTLNFSASVTDYPASAGWVLKYHLAPRGSGAAINFTATASGDDFLIQTSAATTASWAAGYYTWSAYVELGSERYTVGRGQLQIRVSSSAMAAGTDDRSHARKTLDAINAVIEQRATTDQQEYTIHGRQLKRMLISDLLVLRDRYAIMAAYETAAENMAAGLPNPRRAGVRFNRI